MAELVDVLVNACAKLGAGDEAAKLAGLHQALAIAEHFGGMQFYLPKAKHLHNLARDIKIWHEFNGKNVQALARKYGLTDVRLYEIIREQRQLHQAKYQPQLFD